MWWAGVCVGEEEKRWKYLSAYAPLCHAIGLCSCLVKKQLTCNYLQFLVMFQPHWAEEAKHYSTASG